MKYNNINISEELMSNLEAAIIEMYAQNIEETKQQLIKRFTDKGYNAGEIKSSTVLIPNHNKEFNVKVIVFVDGGIEISDYIKNGSITAKVNMYEPHADYTKNVNTCLVEVAKKYQAYVQACILEREKLFLSIGKLPVDNTDRPALHNEDHGAYVYSGSLAMQIDGKLYPATQAMADHFAKIKKAHTDAIEAEKEEKKAALEAGKKALLEWSNKFGSELLKLRIKHDQNWQSLAETEWAIAHVTNGFEPWSFIPDSAKDWTVNNATIEQIRLLDAEKKQMPNHKIDIMRSRWQYEEDDIHRTFLRCEVKTPVGNVTLFKEIMDVSENE